MEATKGEGKGKAKAFNKIVRDWVKAHPNWENEKYYLKAVSSISEATRKGYRSAIPKFCAFVNEGPDQIIENRAQHKLSSDPGERAHYETKMREFKDFMISLNYKGSSIKTTLGYIAGLFSNNSLSLDLNRNFYSEEDESEYVKRTTQKMKQYPTNDEIRSVYGISDLDTQVMILLGYQTAQNPIDCVKTSWDQIGIEDWENEDRDWIPVQRSRSKTDIGFIFVIGPDLKYALTQKWIKDGKPSRGYIFPKRIDRDGKREYDSTKYLASNKVNEKFKSYAEIALGPERAKEISFIDLRDSFNDSVLQVVENDEIKSVLMGHTRQNAKKKYLLSPTTLIEEYKKVYDLITVNGWKFKLKAEGFDELQGDLLDMKKIVVRLEDELNAYKATNFQNEAYSDSLKEENDKLRARLTELESTVKGLVEYVKVLKGSA